MQNYIVLPSFLNPYNIEDLTLVEIGVARGSTNGK